MKIVKNRRFICCLLIVVVTQSKVLESRGRCPILTSKDGKCCNTTSTFYHVLYHTCAFRAGTPLCSAAGSAASVQCDFEEAEENKGLFEKGVPLFEGDLKEDVMSEFMYGNRQYKWTDAVVPYTIETGLKDNSCILLAIKEWTERSCVRFIGRTDEKHYLKFTTDMGCTSSFGMRYGGVQTISVAGCRDKGVIMHLIGHTLGLGHENIRPDMNDYLVSYSDRSFYPEDKARRITFRNYSSPAFIETNHRYDYTSIMHFGLTQFAKKRSPSYDERTFYLRGNATVSEIYVGQREKPSWQDLQNLNYIYGCSVGKDIVCTDPLGKPDRGYCYFASYVHIKGGSIDSFCAFDDAEGLSILDYRESNFIKTKILSSVPSTEGQFLWIGLSRKQGKWKWSDGSAFTRDFANWKGTEPQEDGCVFIDKTSGKWDLKSCENESFSYICKYMGCKNGWQRFEGACYIHSLRKDFVPRLGTDIDFEVGEDVCKKYFNAKPLSIHSAKENEFVQQELMKRRVDSVWIGLWKLGVDDWIWNDGSILDYSNWHETPKINHGRSRLCAYMMAKGGWYVQECDSVRKHYICKYRPLKVSSADAQWSQWGKWTRACSKTCGNGKRTRTRNCTEPGEDTGARNCTQLYPHGYGSVQEWKCSTQKCPANGGWSEWGAWSVPCKKGFKTRLRSCTNPVPEPGGRNCLGKSNQSLPCAINGGWSAWGSWRRCSTTCELGQRRRERFCNNPTPQYGGKSCQAVSGQSNMDYKDCLGPKCPVHGGWTIWSPWSVCTVTCGNGTKSKRRTCSNPKQDFGGKHCSKNKEFVDIEEENCMTKIDCPVDGEWMQWGNWSACECELGESQRTRVRNCTLPMHGGKTCRPDSGIGATMVEECANYECASGSDDDKYKGPSFLSFLPFKFKDRNDYILFLGVAGVVGILVLIILCCTIKRTLKSCCKKKEVAEPPRAYYSEGPGFAELGYEGSEMPNYADDLGSQYYAYSTGYDQDHNGDADYEYGAEELEPMEDQPTVGAVPEYED